MSQAYKPRGPTENRLGQFLLEELVVVACMREKPNLMCLFERISSAHLGFAGEPCYIRDIDKLGGLSLDFVQLGAALGAVEDEVFGQV